MPPKWASAPAICPGESTSCRSQVDETQHGSDDDGSRSPTTDGYEIAVKDSHGDRGHSQQAISVS